MSNVVILILVGAAMFAILGGVTLLNHYYNLNNIKSKTVGDGQHGTARWATRKEIKQTYKHIPFTPKRWREQAKSGIIPTVAHAVKRKKKKGKAVEEQALPQGIIVGCEGNTTALVDTGDVHVLMIGAAGVGKTAFWLYPCIEYACASGMSFLSVDTKGDVMRNYGNIAKEYGYHVSVVDLRNISSTNTWTYIRRIPTNWCTKLSVRSTQKSSPKPSFSREWTPPHSVRMPTSTTRRRDC